MSQSENAPNHRRCCSVAGWLVWRVEEQLNISFAKLSGLCVVLFVGDDRANVTQMRVVFLCHFDLNFKSPRLAMPTNN